jgi:hypothetical protein
VGSIFILIYDLTHIFLQVAMMKVNNSNQIIKLLFGIALAGTILLIGIGMSGSPVARAQEAWTDTPIQSTSPGDTPFPIQGTPEPTLPPQSLPTSAPASNDFYSLNALSVSNGIVIDQMIIHGPPVPPPGFEIQRQAVPLPEILSSAGTNILTVPAYPWVYGCSAVSGAMIAGYYDRNGYSNIYSGPTDSGVMPLAYKSSWGTWVDVPPSPSGSFTYYNNPLVASKLGLDGRTTKGSLDDYWVQYFSDAPDPYIGNWTPHTWGDAIGDYMQTSQYLYNGSPDYGLGDGYTRFYDIYPASGTKLSCTTIASYVSDYGYPPDGTLGRKLFYESKGYAVTDCYNQYTDNQYAGGFSYTQFKTEIDAGRPVMINLAGHTIVGVGYADPNTIYIHDTWDSANHTMTWGGSYAGMQMVAVSIVNLAPIDPYSLTVIKTGAGSGTVTSSPPGIDCGSDCYEPYALNTVVTLTANASTGSAFLGWTGSGCSGTGTCTVTVTSSMSVSAAFTLSDLTITKLTIFPASPTVNEDIQLSVDVSNLSPVASTTFRIEFYVDDIWKSCWYLGVPPREYFARISGLAGNASGSWSYTIPAGTLTTGAHTISAYVDMGCEVAEANENNNSIGPVSVTVRIPPPGEFSKASPADGATNQPSNLTLGWAASTNATSYSYCLDTIDDDACNTSWISTGTNTGVVLSGLTPATRYWQVRATNSSGTTYADGSSTAWRSFTVLPIPGAFIKIDPPNGATGLLTNPSLSWGPSSNVSYYQYCVNTSVASCTSWTNTTNTYANLSGLTPGGKYYWQVRARNNTGITYANGGSITAGWFSFTVLPSPGAFNKTSPVNGATGQIISPALVWGASSNASSYEYCLNTAANCNSPASWLSAGSATSISPGGLTPGLTYYWQVRAINPIGAIYANGGSLTTGWFSLTILPYPGIFNKSSPADTASSQPSTPTLTWGASSNAASYQYCLNTAANCNAPAAWLTTGSSTSVSPVGLLAGTTYYWQVRAVNANGTTYSNSSSSSWWSFSTFASFGDFNKTSPINGAINQPSSVTLTWGASTGAIAYSYCIDTINDNACNASWVSTGTATSKVLSGLTAGTRYWQVRVTNASGTTYADGSSAAWWSFSVPTVPGAFNKLSPTSGAINQPVSPTLSWGASSGVSYYQYCVSTIANSCASWSSTTGTSVILSSLNPGVTYYWVVRARNAAGITYANGCSLTSGWFSFTIIQFPGAFNKSGPANGAVGQLVNPTLQWGASSRAVSYEYCLVTLASCNDASTWISTGTSVGVTLSGLNPGTTYYWQVRSRNALGVTYANTGTGWAFSTLALPTGFAKISPTDAANNQPSSLTLTWGTSTGAASYSYCIDTIDDDACNTSWVSTGTTPKITLSSLSAGTRYWQVRATNSAGSTYAGGGSSAWWSFNIPPLPGAFNKLDPVNGASNLAPNLTLNWGASSNVVDYQYCLNTSATSCGAWSTTVGTSVALTGMNSGVTYYWQVRARNAVGTTYSNGGSLTSGWFSFTTIQYPGAFNKTSPANLVTGQAPNLKLSWAASSRAVSYEYCLDSSSTCTDSSTWISTGTSVSVVISGLTPGATYYWQVRAKNNLGTTYANTGTVWSFTTLGLPSGFTKVSPADGAINRPASLVLSWAASPGAASYAYCIDAINDDACNTSWISTGTATSVALSGLTPSTRYWQVRATNAAGTVYADGSSTAWWSFIVPPIPGAFSKLGPANAALGQPTNPTITWGSSAAVSYYQYCVNTSATSCSVWSNTVSTSAVISGLTPGAKYYWHVRARNSTGITFSDGGSLTTGWFSFTVAP